MMDLTREIENSLRWLSEHSSGIDAGLALSAAIIAVLAFIASRVRKIFTGKEGGSGEKITVETVIHVEGGSPKTDAISLDAPHKWPRIGSDEPGMGIPSTVSAQYASADALLLLGDREAGKDFRSKRFNDDASERWLEPGGIFSRFLSLIIWTLFLLIVVGVPFSLLDWITVTALDFSVYPPDDFEFLFQLVVAVWIIAAPTRVLIFSEPKRFLGRRVQAVLFSPLPIFYRSTRPTVDMTVENKGGLERARVMIMGVCIFEGFNVSREEAHALASFAARIGGQEVA